ncbi:MAG: DUF294 nucleotidyltransferase-like domain-containing protein [Oleibacter sp.]|nr:DUF294 nucleotidyltransferase-like domain-containing protein [Thalassolituus sp.]
MTVNIDLRQPPFSFLTESQRSYLAHQLDMKFYAKGEAILTAGQHAPGIFIIYKGVVEEQGRDGQVFSQYGIEDIFDVRGVLESGCKHSYHAVEETLCYFLERHDFIELLNKNADFSMFFDSDLGSRELLIEQQDAGLSEFILARIDEDTLRPLIIIDADTTLAVVAETMKSEKADALLVQQQVEHAATRFGIVTGTDLLQAVLTGPYDKYTPVEKVATFELIGIDYGDYLYQALLVMTQHHLERLVVRQDQQWVGMIELKDLLSSFSTHSHIVAMRIDQANTVDDLVIAAGRLHKLIANLDRHGVKMIAITSLITTLNRRLMQRAFDMIMPLQVRQNVCLLVLGSEGRGEQILKTDQDNAVIFRDEDSATQAQPLLNEFHEVLLRFGYPPCPGGVMFINRPWAKTVAGWHKQIQTWLNNPTPDAMMNLSIFIDGEAIAGEVDLYTDISSSWRASHEHSIVASRLALPAVKFSPPITLLGKLKDDHGALDIKKGGIFPLVHGVRALAFEFGLHETNTLDRLDRLVTQRVLTAHMAQGLKDSLVLFLRIRLRHQLLAESMQDSANSAGLNQNIQVDELRSVDRSLLRHGLHRVKKFRQWLIQHYHLENF